MGTIVIKPDPDLDFYVGWSTIVEAPTWFGSRTDALRYIAEDHRRSDGPADPPGQRLARADKYGSSVKPEADYGFGYWDDDGFIYEQRGILPRKHLVEACRRLGRNDEAGVWDLLEPFEDETEVRRG